MPFAFLLALATIAGATLLTYLYDSDALLWSRLCGGVCVGFAAIGLVGFVLASWLGMTPLALSLSGLICGSPLLLLFRRKLRERCVEETRNSLAVLRRALALRGKGGTGALIFYLVAALILWLVFGNAMYQNARGVFTGVDTNIGDLPFHIAVISGFVHGENFPPQHPEFAGVRLTYPFIVDFVTAMFVRAGATLEGAMFWQNFVTMISLVGLLHRWALKLTRERVAALMTPALVLLSGGFGWYVFFGEAWSGERGFFGQLLSLDHDYTIMGHLGYQWGNAVTALFVTQRGIVLGLALALVVWVLWWEAGGKAEGGRRKTQDRGEADAPVIEARSSERKGVGGKRRAKEKSRAERVRGKQKANVATSYDAAASSDDSFAFCLKPFAMREMVAAGMVAGLLPLVHAHSFVVMMVMGACLALLQGAFALALKRDGEDELARKPVWMRVWSVWRPWLAFACVASVLAVPQMFWATRDSGARAGQFLGWEFGWAHGTENIAWFWIKNTAFFIPLLITALAWRGREPIVSRRLLFFYMPFALCFVVPNVYKLSPWVWDNIKILIYWWVASAPLVALALARLWRMRGAWRAVAFALLLGQTAAGGLDVWRAASGAVERRTFDASGVAFADIIMRETQPRSLILHAPTYNDPVYMTGRRTFLGYTGHVWSHGIDYAAREADLNRIYAGGADAATLLTKNGIEYIVVGPLEREELKKSGVTINENFFRQFRKVGEAGEYRLYKTQP